jgi:tetratricopeptide (TPR) repeat protein
MAAFAQGAPLFRFEERPGSHRVGLKVVEQYDYSRVYRRSTDALGKPYSGERTRPLQTLIWYPADGGGTPMTVGDYAKLMATETSFGKPESTAYAKDWISGMAPTLSTPLWAVRDAPFAPGRFPVVIYAPSLSAMSWENADLCEYLASHGYVVIASPDLGVASRDMSLDLAGANAQARDISFLIGYASSLQDTDSSRVAVAGFSWGGLSNLFAAARDNRIDALIGLDGSLRYFGGIVKQAGDVHPEQMTIPLLEFTQGEITLEEQARWFNDPSKNDGPNVLNAWTHGDLITVRMLGLVHTEFSSMYQRNEDDWKSFHRSQKADYEREDGIAGYSWVARYTVEFLDAYLKHDASAVAYLKRTPAENGAPKHFMTVSYRSASGIPASFDGFRAEVGRRGFDHAAEIYAAMHKDKADFKLDQAALDSWCAELIDEGHFPEGVTLLQLNVQIHPDSSDAYASLGRAYMKSGQRQLAIDNYKRSMELDPANDEAEKFLKESGVLGR